MDHDFLHAEYISDPAPMYSIHIKRNVNVRNSCQPTNYADGKLSDIFGRKSTLVTIVCFFLLGSWLCGIANSMVQMGIARAIAGLGGGGIMTMASVVIHDLLPMRRRGQYQSYVNMAQTVSTHVNNKQ